MYGLVMVPVDGTPQSERALPYAECVVRACGARVVLVRAVPAMATHGAHPAHAAAADSPPLAAPSRAMEPGMRQESTGVAGAQTDLVHEAEAYLTSVAARFAELGPVDTLVRRGSAVEVILGAVGHRQPDLLVMASRCHHDVLPWRPGSVADEVLRHTHVPMLLIPPAAEAVWDQRRPRRVLVPLDGSRLAETALGPAVNLAQTVGAEVRLLRVVTPPDPVLYAETLRGLDYNEDAERGEARAYLQHVADRLRAAIGHVPVSVVTGSPAAAINCAATEQDCCVVAMVTHGRGGLSRLFLGSVTTAALEQASVPYILIHPETTAHRAMAPDGAPGMPYQEVPATRHSQ